MAALKEKGLFRTQPRMERGDLLTSKGRPKTEPATNKWKKGIFSAHRDGIVNERKGSLVFPSKKRKKTIKWGKKDRSVHSGREPSVEGEGNLHEAGGSFFSAMGGRNGIAT